MNVLTEMFSSLDTHWFWVIMTVACLVWYSTITVYVAFKGFGDIRRMLKRMSGPRGPAK